MELLTLLLYDDYAETQSAPDQHPAACFIGRA
jgi:hypothetical protein